MWNDRHVKLMPVRQMLTRRGFLEQISTGLGGIAFFSLLRDGMGATDGPHFDVLPKKPHSQAKAKRVILLFQNGGPSHMDLFDPKPELRKQHGEKPGADFMKTIDVKRIGQGWMGSPFRFSRFGRSGMELSELIPRLATPTRLL